MLKLFQLENTWSSSNLILPLKGAWKKQREKEVVQLVFDDGNELSILSQ
jgi:hypothetical protein